jgi:hypothetical protein
MKWWSLCGYLFPLFLVGGSVAGQTVPIHQQIKQTYSFQPHLLNKQERDQASAVLDRFWAKAKADQVIYVPALREELGDFNNPAFFLYDGSALLLSLSDTPVDRKVALAAMAHCDLSDVQSKDYFFQVHRLAGLKEDTDAAAFHILEQPKFQVFIPQHVLTLGQNYCLIYLLLPTSQDHWLQPAMVRLTTEHDETAQKSLLLLLWYAQTDAADQAISAFAGDVGKPAASRAYARELTHRKDQIGLTQRTQALSMTVASLRQKRQERLKAVSDEALGDLDDYTAMLMAKRK